MLSFLGLGLGRIHYPRSPSTSTDSQDRDFLLSSPSPPSSPSQKGFFSTGHDTPECPPKNTNKLSKIEANWKEIEQNLEFKEHHLRHLRFQQAKIYGKKETCLITGREIFIVRDYGTSTSPARRDKHWIDRYKLPVRDTMDFNLCFYLCIFEGQEEEAQHLKNYLASCVRKLDDNTINYEKKGVMADSDVLHTFCLEYNSTLHIIDESNRKRIIIQPKNGTSEQTIYLLRRSFDHYQRLYPWKFARSDRVRCVETPVK